MQNMYLSDVSNADFTGFRMLELIFYKVSTLHMCRVLELDLVCSQEMKNWIRENNVELTCFKKLG